MNRTMTRAALTFLAFFTVARADAAIITWGAATNIAGDSDVSVQGSLVGALNLGGTGVAATTVNGTTFGPLALAGNSGSSGPFSLSIGSQFFSSNATGSPAAPFNNLSAGYQSLLSSSAGAFTDPFNLTISGLTAGRRYLFEFFSSNSQPFTSLVTATAGNSVTLSSNTTTANGGLGQFAVGTFAADGATQTITFASGVRSVLNGFQVRDVTAVPEPASLTMLALGLAGVGLAVRSRIGRRQARGDR